MRHGSGLPNPVFLRTPDFKEWVVYWTKKNGEVWFVKGWKEFVKHYSLGYGALVVFNYKGSFHIDVLIHDTSGVEIDYLSPSNGSANTENVNTEDEDEDEDVHTDVILKTVNATENEQNASPMPLTVCSPPRGETRMWKVKSHNVKQVKAGVGPSDKGTNGTNVRTLIRHEGMLFMKISLLHLKHLKNKYTVTS